MNLIVYALRCIEGIDWIMITGELKSQIDKVWEAFWTKNVLHC